MNFFTTLFSGAVGGAISLFGNKLTYDGHVFQKEQIRVSKTVDIGLQYVEILDDFSTFVLKYNKGLKLLMGDEVVSEITSADFLECREFNVEEAEKILKDKGLGFTLEDISVYSNQMFFVIFLIELSEMGIIDDLKAYNPKEVNFKEVETKLREKRDDVDIVLFNIYEKLRDEQKKFNVALNKMECLNLIPLMKVSKERELYNLLNNIFIDEISILFFHISYCRNSEARPSYENTVGVYEEFYKIYEERKNIIEEAEKLAKQKKDSLKQKNKVKS